MLLRSIMITMKKKYCNILIITIIVLLLTMFVVLVCTRTNNLSILVLEKHYSLLYDTMPKIDISLYSNQPESKYLKSSKIENVKIYNDTDLYSVKIDEIVSTNNSITYQNNIYYENKLTLTLDVVSEQAISISNAKLLIEYDSDEFFDVEIGNIAFSKENINNSLNIHKVQGIVNDFGLYQSLSAIHLKVSSEYDLIINNISLISPTVNVNYDYLLLGDELYYDHTTPAKEIFGSSFNSFICENNSFSKIHLTKNIQKDVIIPLHYSEKELLDSVGLLIEYTINGIEYIYTVNPYKLFNTNDIEYFLHEYKISTN